MDDQRPSAALREARLKRVASLRASQRRAARFAGLLACVLGVLFVIAALYPFPGLWLASAFGFLALFPVLLAPPLLLLLIVWLHAVIVGRWSRMRTLATLVVLVLLLLLNANHQLLRVVFPVLRPAFDRRIDTWKADPSSAPAANGRNIWIGPYRVDVCQGPGGIHWIRNGSWRFFGTTSWGFVRSPQGNSCPFGSIGFQLFDLDGEWSLFIASDE